MAGSECCIVLRSATVDLLQNIFRVIELRRIIREEPLARMKEIRISKPS
jgi:hypothetical protein